MTKEEVVESVREYLDRKQVTSIRAFAFYCYADEDRMISNFATDPSEPYPLTSAFEATVIASAYGLNPQDVLDGKYIIIPAASVGVKAGAVKENTNEPSPYQWSAPPNPMEKE